MLHNNGPFGPNETPINMGAQQISGTINTLSNPGKISQQQRSTTNLHYGIPDYTSYNHTALSATNPNPFQNYNIANFDSHYMAQNTLHYNTNLNSLQNGLIPMNLNVQSTHTMPDYTNFKDQKDLPINIPQYHAKAFQKPSEHINRLYVNNTHFAYGDSNLDLSIKSQGKTEQEISRRKSLENTVRLIENILIKSTSKSGQVKDNSIVNKIKEEDKSDSTQKTTESPKTMRQSVQKMTESKSTEIFESQQKITNESTDISLQSNTKEHITDNNTLEENITRESEAEKVNADLPTSLDIIETKEKNIDFNLTKETIVEEDANIEIKKEVSNWTDTDSFNPFHRDTNGMLTEDVAGNNVVDSEISIQEAMNVIKNDKKPSGLFECPNCALLVSNPKRFLIHTKWHSFGLTNEKRMELSRERELKRTQRKEARDLEKINLAEVKDMKMEGKTYPCKDCEKVFSGKAGLKNHRTRFHPSYSRECKLCHIKLSGWHAFRAHLATHTSETGYQCSECPKKFKYSHSLAKHRDTHLEKTHPCEQCTKMFGSEALLKLHMKTHERALRGATFRCTYCGKGFFESYNLQVHERTHRNEKPFSCQICNTAFGTNSSLKRHLKVSHSTSKPYECTECHRCFISETILTRHFNRVHGKPENFNFFCEHCTCRYMKSKDLRKHMYKVHPKNKKDYDSGSE